MLIKLGVGSRGTVVYKGSLRGRLVAVKRLDQEYVTVASTVAKHEVDLLKQADRHPNIIRYFYDEAGARFFDIALELCYGSLFDYIEKNHRTKHPEFSKIAASFNEKRALHEITCGVEHLHSLDILHRNISPKNILIASAAGESGRYRMVISGFGHCQKLKAGETSFLPTAASANGGYPEWRAREILRWNADTTAAKDIQLMRQTKSVDMFALGCVYYYCITEGSHPFGVPHEREDNIKNGKMPELVSRSGWAPLDRDGPEAVDLIRPLLDHQPSKRFVC